MSFQVLPVLMTLPFSFPPLPFFFVTKSLFFGEVSSRSSCEKLNHLAMNNIKKENNPNNNMSLQIQINFSPVFYVQCKPRCCSPARGPKCRACWLKRTLCLFSFYVLVLCACFFLSLKWLIKTQIFRDGLEGGVREQVWARCTLDERDWLIHHMIIENKTQNRGILTRHILKCKLMYWKEGEFCSCFSTLFPCS